MKKVLFTLLFIALLATLSGLLVSSVGVSFIQALVSVVIKYW